MIQQRPRLFSGPPSIRLEGQRQSEVAGIGRCRGHPTEATLAFLAWTETCPSRTRPECERPWASENPMRCHHLLATTPVVEARPGVEGSRVLRLVPPFVPRPLRFSLEGCALRARVGRGVGEPRPPCRSRRRSVLDARGSCSATPDGRGEQPRVGSPPWRAPSRNASPDTRCEQLSRAARRPVGFRE